jgi:hypothetical protein
MRPLVIDLFCGLGGWAQGFLAEGYTVIGFDIERHRYPKIVRSEGPVKKPGLNWSDRSKRGSKDAQFNRPPEIAEGNEWDEYPGQLVLQDVLTLHGRQFKSAAVIVASPPCQAYSYRAMPWKRAKALPPPDNSLFDACFRIQREASEAAGHHIPMIVENVRGAQKWVGRSRWNYGSFHLWGDVPALMPITNRAKIVGCGANLPGIGWTGFASQEGGVSWRNRERIDGIKTPNHINQRNGHQSTKHLTNPSEHGIKQHGSGPIWFDTGIANHGSHSSARKAASAMIAKIPFPLARHIARVFKGEL